MPFIHCYLIIVILFPLVIHANNRNTDHNKDLYFEVLEPSDISYTFRCRPAKELGNNFNQIHKNIYLIPAKPMGGCSRLQNQFELDKNIAFIERGGCSFVTKIIHAQETGAIGVLIMDNDRTGNGQFVDMIDDLTKRTVQIPAMFLQYRDGHMILNSIEKNHLIGVRINIPLNLTYNEILKTNRAPGSNWL